MSMTYDDYNQKFFHALHEIVGVCGHCGKRKCAGKASHSILPETISLDNVIAASVRMKIRKSKRG